MTKRFSNSLCLHAGSTNTGRILATLSVVAILGGCSTAAEHYHELGATEDRAMTVGLVQKNVSKGLSQSAVATTLGSPNIVTKDIDGKETWIYDKVASEASFSQGTGNVNSSLSGIGSAFRRQQRLGHGQHRRRLFQIGGAASVTQRTLTVVIKFDPSQRVDTVTYHSTKF